jgi:hypothetical protein
MAWLPDTSVVVAPARSAIVRCNGGGISRAANPPERRDAHSHQAQLCSGAAQTGDRDGVARVRIIGPEHDISESCDRSQHVEHGSQNAEAVSQ